MKAFETLAVIAAVFSASAASAETYTCSAKANPNRGFESAFQISLDSTAVGGKMVLIANGAKRLIGTISEAAAIDGTDPAQKQAFDATLGMIAEEDVSGVAEKDLSLVDKLVVYRAEIAGGDEALVYRLFASGKQLGGTFFVSGMGTSCL